MCIRDRLIGVLLFRALGPQANGIYGVAILLPNMLVNLMSFGLSATVGSFAIAGLSDAIGRRPVMIATPLIAIILPLGAMYFHGSYAGMAAIFFVGWSLNGIFPLFMATVPSESVPPAMAATVFGLCMGSCEILGGAAGPALAGMAADTFGLAAPLWMMIGLALVGTIAALGLRETAPRVLLKRSNPA